MSTQKVTGLVSGFDTQSIVESLMKLEKQPYEKLDVKKQTEQLKLQAYQAVNTYLLKFRNSIGTLSSTKLWNSKATVSTNEKSITATANEYAVNGSYSFKVAQLAAATQYMSKGFASSKSPLVAQKEGEAAYKLGTINLASAKTRVDNSAKLETLNGGKGVFRGSVRVTDSSNTTSIIDLSSCDTMDDVVRTLNESSGAQISASIKDGKLVIEDLARGAGSLRIQNVGAGTTANDLGISGTTDRDVDGNLVSDSRNVYVLGDDMLLSMLNDGLGVEEGDFALRVSGPSSFVDLIVDVEGCKSVGDVVKRVNDQIEKMISDNEFYVDGGAYPKDLLEGLRFGVSGDKTSFSFTGTKAGQSYLFFDYDDGLASNATAGEDLGLHNRLRLAANDGDEVKFGRVLGDVNSPMLKNLAGINGGGVGESYKFSTAFNQNTLLSELDGGKGLDVSRPMQIQLWEGMKDVAAGVKPRIIEDLFDPVEMQKLIKGELSSYCSTADGPTIVDLQRYMNDKLQAYAADPTKSAAGLTGMSFEIDYDNNRMYIAGAQSGYTLEIGGTTAGQLGLWRQSGSSSYPGLEIDEDYTYYTQVTNALKAFYDSTGSGSVSLVGDNNAFQMDPSKTLTTLADLVGWHGLTAGDPGMDAAIASLLAQPLTMEFNNGTAHAVTVDLTNLVDKNGVPTTVDSTTDIKTFMDAVNATIQKAFDDYTTTNSLDPMSAPKMAVHNLQDRFQWTNMDFSKGWEFSGGIIDDFAMDRSIANLPPQENSAVHHDVNPASTGIVTPKTADRTTQLKDLNYGLGLTFSGDPDDSLMISLGDGNDVEVTMAELRQLVYGQGWSDGVPSTVTLGDYLDGLNNLINTKLSGVGSGTASLEFDVKNGNIVVKNIHNASELTITGYGASALQTGIAGGKLENVEAGKEYVIGAINAADIVKKPVDGLGEIAFKIGSTEYRLSTSNLTNDCTLNDLIDALNGQLADLAKDPANAAVADVLKKISFSINDAGTGIAVQNDSNTRVTFVDTKDQNTLAQNLGLVGAKGEETRVESYSHVNLGSLGRNYISRATQLSDYIGKNAEMGGIQITNSQGQTKTIGLENVKTVGDLLDAINYYFDDGFGVYAQLNERGDGITIVEAYPNQSMVPSADKVITNIGIQDVEGGSVAKKMGIAGTGTRDKAEYKGNSVIEGSLSTTIDVMSSDTLESIMYRISEAGYKTAIVNDGSSANPYRLTISASTTGEASDFVIDSDIALFGFNQTSRGRDAKVLYGDPNSNSSPVMLSSSTNSNSNAVLGLTLDLKQVSSEWTTITVDTDKEKVKDEIKAMVESYNELAGIITMLDAYDEETGEPGILFGDTSVRNLLDSINEIFYDIYNPNNKMIGSVDANGKQNTWTWMDLGISLSAANSNADGSGNWYTTMELDTDKLDDMVASNWDVLSKMLANQRNAANSGLDDNVKATASFNGSAAAGFDPDYAINGDYSRGTWGAGNGFMADGTIEDGNNEYTIWFQKPTTVTRMSIYHYDSATALKDFTVEYLDANTGKWETLREIASNATDANHLGLALPTSVNAIRIKASSTNASDDKFRLLDVQVFEETGLAGKLNQLTSTMGDTQHGFLAERNTEITNSIKDIEEQMSRLQERLDAKEASLWRRFTAMEKAMGTMQNQSSYFSSMMSSMNNSSKK